MRPLSILLALAAWLCSAFLAGAALVLFVWRRQRLYAAGAVVVGLTAALAMLGGFTSDWIDHLGRRSPPELLFLAASFLAPVLAVLLTGARSGGPVEEPS